MLNPARVIEDHSQTASLLADLADYASAPVVAGDSVIGTARQCLLDALGRCFEALRDPEYASCVGPLVPGALMPGGARVPGTSLELDPAQAAFCNSLLLCRPDGDRRRASGSFRAADPLGAILAVADYRARKAAMEGESPPNVRDVLAAIVKALQIQDALALECGHRPPETTTLRFTRIATTAIVAVQLGGTRGQIVTALAHACLDGGMSGIADSERDDIGRGGWAAADALGRAVRHACQAVAGGQSGHPTSAQLESIDIAGGFPGGFPGARPRTAGRRPFGDGAGDRLAGPYEPHETVWLTAKLQDAVGQYFPARQAERIKTLFAAPERLDELPVNELLAALVTNGAR